MGSFISDNQGGLSVTLPTPDTLPAGYHTIAIEGISPPGEPLELTQTVVILGSNPNDRDENGIPDNTQRCGLFLADNMCDIENADGSISGSNEPQDEPTKTSVGAKNANTPALFEGLTGQASRSSSTNNSNGGEVLGTSIQTDNDKIDAIDNRRTKAVTKYSLPYVFMATGVMVVSLATMLICIRRKK